MPSLTQRVLCRFVAAAPDAMRLTPASFVPRAAVEADASPLRPLLTSGRPVARPSALEALLSTKGFERVQVDVAMEGQDPHAVGVAFRSNAAAPAAPLSSSSGGKAAGGGSKRSKGPSTGFGGS